VATLQMSNLPIIDQPRWPAMDAETTPAYLDFKLVLKGTEQPVKYEDPARQLNNCAATNEGVFAGATADISSLLS
jgi:hypothetical protein